MNNADSNENIKDKKTYELALLLKSEEDVLKATAILKQHGGELVSEPRAKKLALAYEIKGQSEAIFAYATFHALPSDAKELERDLLNRPEILRSMIVIAEAQSDRPADMSALPPMHRSRTPVNRSASTAAPEARPSAPRGPLSNEALEKKIEEILQ
jgi:ribosomal protein S6